MVANNFLTHPNLQMLTVKNYHTKQSIIILTSFPANTVTKKKEIQDSIKIFVTLTHFENP